MSPRPYRLGQRQTTTEQTRTRIITAAQELFLDKVLDVLYTLISFECFDTLAGPTRSIEEVVPIVQQLARAALGLNEG